MPTMTLPRGAPRGSSLLDQLASELALREKAVSSTPSLPYEFGPGGLWSYPGLERPVISTRVKPRGIASMLPARPTNAMNPLYPYLTGFTNPAEVQPDGVCDDPPSAGQLKNCFQTATWGRYSYQTRVFDLTRLGQVVNRAEFTDLMLWNDPLGNVGGNSITNPSSTPGSLQITNEASVRFAEVGMKFQNKLMRQLWDGNPANNTGGGGYREFNGLDILISTGHTDAVTGVSCPTLDSTIMNAAFLAVTDVSAPATSIINRLTYMLRSLRNLASRTGLDPVQHVLVMREELFYELTAVWPCNYLTYRCMTMSGTGATYVGDPGDAIAMRDAMRQGSYIIVDGVQYPVAIDDGMAELTNADNGSIPVGSFASDIVILPMTVQGNKASLFWEYFDFSGPMAAFNGAVQSAMPLVQNFFWTDGGQYIWHMKPPTNWCVQWLGLIEPRVILLTPHLAGRINNIVYTPLLNVRDAYSDQPNYVNGGNTVNGGVWPQPVG
jgi:hypothetical protein